MQDTVTVFMSNKILIVGIVAAIALSMTVATAVIILKAQPASAQPSTPGASSLAPGQIIGPDKPPGTEKDLAPGQIIGPGQPANSVSPGQEALTAGIIGPEIKK
jgi:hypothetical protein